ncbi:NUDIX hydrolase [Roseibium sp. RKSG952]|uniref:NUDIX hydrolase n=1 Tax=Roseibium sp. RKSG952 TaxID=2529384 RepID=UPI0012BBEE96|nr:NUDIX hydrolase [Roseibium sp. RKSG952]MTH96485.1 NUDIX hydrolase [Roseibium sp. RKSG952]
MCEKFYTLSFYVQENPDWICVLPLTPEGQVVLVREYRHGAGEILTGLVGGTLENGDASPLHTARRELQEETGYRCAEMVTLGAAYANCRNHTNKVHYFLARNAFPASAQALDETEDIDVVLAPLAEVAAPGFLKQSYHIACLHLALPLLEPAQSRGYQTP